MGTIVRVVFVALALLAACGGPEPFDHGFDHGVDLPEFRIPGSDRLAEEPWVAHVAVLDDGVKIRLEYEPADGGPRERMLAAGEDLPWPTDLEAAQILVRAETPQETTCLRVATVLHASADQLLLPTLRRLPVEPGFHMPRLYLAGAGGATIPIIVPRPWAEIEINRLGRACQIQDITRGLVPEAVTWLRITRSGERVRYRWMRDPLGSSAPPWSGGDRTLEDGGLRVSADRPIIPDLIRHVEPRHEFEDGSRAAIVHVGVGEHVRVIDFLRGVECGRGDPAILFDLWPTTWGWNDSSEFYYSIHVPRSERRLEPETWASIDQSRDRPLRISVTADGRAGERNWPCPPEKLQESLRRYARHSSRVRTRIVLRFDGGATWMEARPWAVRASATGIELALRFQHGDYWLDCESELRLPVEPEGECLPMMAAEVAERAAEAKGWVVLLSAPDSATVNDVWQAALTVMDAGAAGVVFE